MPTSWPSRTKPPRRSSSTPRTVAAGTEEEAYREGGKLLTQAGVFPVQAGKFANDYVHRVIKV